MTGRRIPSGVRFEHLYVHVPFCARRCVYCDFSIAVRPTVPVDEFVGALEAEWSVRHADHAFALRTLYFGGGTPSKLGGDGIARSMDVVRAHATIEPRAEVTLEANPEDVSASAARSWLAAGINRVSLGVQSFDDRVLKWMHRTHDTATARRAIEVLRDAGAQNVSIDLIFAAPATLERDWPRDLDAALAYGLQHLSIYGLTVEPRTPLGRWVARSEVAEAAEDAFAEEFLQAHAALTDAGFEHYEVSNYGRPQSHSMHNWAYWMRTPYAGIGPAAHEFDGSHRRWNEAAYAGWVARVGSGSDPVEGRETLGAEQILGEDTYLRLRTSRGVQLRESEVQRAEPWVREGWASVSGDLLTLTAAGWLRLDAIVSDLTLVRSRY